MMIQLMVFLSVTFVLGVALGWVIWKFGNAAQPEADESEVHFWQQRLDQARMERDRQLDKIAALERERDNLKKRITAMKS